MNARALMAALFGFAGAGAMTGGVDVSLRGIWPMLGARTPRKPYMPDFPEMRKDKRECREQGVTKQARRYQIRFAQMWSMKSGKPKRNSLLPRGRHA